MEKANVRYGLLDTLRGIALVSMVIYHAVWDMVYIFNEHWLWYSSVYARIWQQSICISFILISGFCFSLGHNKLKRGLIVLLCGGLISVVTNIFLPDEKIFFGVLVLIGSCMLIAVYLEKIMAKANSYIGFTLSLLLFILLKNIGKGHILSFTLPQFLYKGFIMSYIGFGEDIYRGVDYFPLIPWIFLFYTGYFLFRIVRDNDMLRLAKNGIEPLSAVGRHTLLIYLVHQPVIYCVLWLFYEMV